MVIMAMVIMVLMVILMVMAIQRSFWFRVITSLEGLNLKKDLHCKLYY